MRLLILLSLLGAAVAGAAHRAGPRYGQRIVGGEPTSVLQYPFMSNMQNLWWGILWYQTCGGSLVTNRMVVSAAHCYIGDSASSWRVMLGSSFASSGGSIHPAEALLLHPQYNDNTLDNDIAIVRLSVAAFYSDIIQPVRIAGPNYNVADGAVVTAIGWGSLSSGGSYPEQLQHVDINIINQAFCVERYAHLKSQPGFQNWPDITDNMICAGIQHIGGKDACQGDSGGPLVHTGDVLVGITSWGYGCAHPDYPGVNARVSRYTDWILANA